MVTDFNSSSDDGEGIGSLPVNPKTERSVQPSAPPVHPVSLSQIDELCDRLSLPKPGRQYLRRAFLHGASRRVRSGRGNVCTRYPSWKMGRVLQAESMIELAYLLQAEHDASIDFILDQPGQLLVTYKLATGRRQSFWITPDYVVGGSESCSIIECKPVKELQRLAAKHPDRWKHTEADGRWRFLPGEEAAQKLGLRFEVFTDEDIWPAYTSNLEFIAPYLGAESPEPDPAAAARIGKLVDDRFGITISELLDAGVSADDLYRMIATGHAYVDLRRDRLADRDQTCVFADENRYRFWQSLNRPAPYPSFGANGEFGAAASPAVPVQEVPQAILGAVSSVSAQAAAVAVERFHIIRPIVCDGKFLDDIGATMPNGPSKRTLQRWCKAWREEQCQSGRGIIGLVPRIEHRGCRSNRLTDEHEALITQVLEDGDDPRLRKDSDLYGEYCQVAEKAGFEACAPATFKKRIQLLDAQRRTRKRRGHKAAAAEAPFVWWIEEVTPRHGQFPWAVVHIDHTLVDLMMRLSGQEPRLLRVWLTVVFCAYSRTVLGFELSFDPPSVASIMMALRDCVRRHGRLPYTIVVDRGSEFESVWFELFCAEYLITKRSRPAGNPRFGSLIERFFGTTNTQFFHALHGNTQLLRDPRGLTPEVDPRRHAIWTLPMLTRALEAYFFEVYASQPHPALGQSPKKMYEQGLRLTGAKEHRTVSFDRDFLISTLPPAPYSGGTAKVQGDGKGIQISGILYWNDAFRSAALLGTRVQVRIDPFDISHVFAWWPGRRIWLHCISEHYKTFRGRSWQEVRILGKEIRKLANDGRKTPRVTAAVLAKFMTRVREIEDAELQRLKDAARDEAGARGATPRLVTEGGVRVDDEPDALPASPPAEFSAEDWNNAPELGEFE